MKIKLPTPENATREMKAAWSIYPDLKEGVFEYSQSHHRERIIELASRSNLSRRQRNEVSLFKSALEAAE